MIPADIISLRKRFRMVTVNLQRSSSTDSGWMGDYGLGSTGGRRRARFRCIPGVAPGSENWNYAERAAGTPSKPAGAEYRTAGVAVLPAEKADAVGRR